MDLILFWMMFFVLIIIKLLPHLSIHFISFMFVLFSCFKGIANLYIIFHTFKIRFVYILTGACKLYVCKNRIFKT